MTKRAREILDFYRSENAGVLSNLARMINHGRLAGTGRFVWYSDFSGGCSTWPSW